MQRIITTNSIAVVLLIALSGCGGEEGNSANPNPSATGNSTPSPSPTPTPSPTSSPIPTQTILRVPFGLKATAEMGVLGFYGKGETLRWLEPGELKMYWEASPGTFSVSLPRCFVPGNEWGTVVDDPSDLAESAVLVVDHLAFAYAKMNLSIPANPNATSKLSLLGFWHSCREGDTASAGSFLYYPKSFVASGARFGKYSNASGMILTIDGTQGTVSGQISLTYSDAWGPYAPTIYPIRNGIYDASTGSVMANFDIPDSGYTGEVRAQLLGPDADILAITIRGAIFNPYDSKWRRAVAFDGAEKQP